MGELLESNRVILFGSPGLSNAGMLVDFLQPLFQLGRPFVESLGTEHRPGGGVLVQPATVPQGRRKRLQDETFTSMVRREFGVEFEQFAGQ